MAAPKGNTFWKARSSHGRNPKFKKPDDLWNACVEYFDWVQKNPLFESKVLSVAGKVRQEPVAKMRAMTISGLCIFLDISEDTWANYGQREGFLGVTTRAERIIRTQKFEGAAADLLNPSIIARDLGLSDKQEVEVFDRAAALERARARVTSKRT